MLADRLIARIRGQLELGTPDLEARSLAGEYASHCQRARERLEQCAALIRAGNEHAAFQAAEAEPDLLGLSALLSFAESERWHALCRERGLPAGFPLDGQHVLAVENLYGKQIGENHPLYRDYRDAIRKRDEDRALSVLRSIVRINPEDPNAQSELTRLSAKFLRESLGKVATFFNEQRDDEAIELMNRMERFGANDLAEEPTWDAALARRIQVLKAQAAEQVTQLFAAAVEARQGNHWEACAAALGRVRSLERDQQLNLSPLLLAQIPELETWAGELAATAEAEASQRASLEHVTEEWAILSQEAAQRASPALLIVRLTQWIERAEAQGQNLPEGLLRKARNLRKITRSRLNRRYIILTSSWVGALLVVISGVVFWNIQKTQDEDSRDRVSEIVRLLELYDHPAALKALGLLERSTDEKDAARQAQLAQFRQRYTAQTANEQRLRTEATELANRRRSGLTSANIADTRQRIEKYLQDLSQVGPELTARLQAIFPAPETMRAAANQSLEEARTDLTLQRTALRKALGDGDSVADIAAAADALERLRTTLATLAASGVKELDEVAAEIDRAGQRLSGEIKTVNALKALRNAADLRGYLAAVASAVTETANEKSDVSRRAAFVAEHAAGLEQLPRSALAPRVAAMWDAAPTADPQGLFQPSALLAPEALAIKVLSDDSLAKSLRKFTVRSYSTKGPEIKRTALIVGEITERRTTFNEGVETIQKGRELGREGDVIDATWSRREFTNGVRAGEDVGDPTALPELAYIRQVTRFQDPQTGRLLEPLLRTMDRIRRSDSPYPELRAYHLQELYRLASTRPEVWGFLFSPSAMREADQLRRITQNALKPYDFLVKEKWADIQPELKSFLIRQGGAPYAEEARFWRAVFSSLRTRKLIFAGIVGRDGLPTLRDVLKDTALYGLDNEGKPAVLFRIGPDGKPQRLADAAPFSPLLRYPGTVTEAIEAAGIPKGLLPPDGGWESILLGRDL